MDLTLFAVVRALDVVVGELWARRKAYKLSVGRWHKSDELVGYFADPALFAGSCALIMVSLSPVLNTFSAIDVPICGIGHERRRTNSPLQWSWVYLPEKLPRAYNKWITSAAAVDARLIKALRLFRWGDLVYGRDTGQSELITSMCADYNLPLIWGDPTKTIPFPCEIVHMGHGPSCEWHAVTRFWKGFATALAMYGGINSVLFFFRPSRAAFKRAVITSLRSSAFLGSFIALFYYGVCLARCRLGPKIIGRDAKAAQRIDGGICIASGCALCGWSLLLENEGRRKDIALFVAPRALATALPRRYEMRLQWRETAAFAVSAATIITCAREKPARVRGVLGKVLGNVLGAR